MKKLFATFLMSGALQATMAYDYPYLVFQTMDGNMQAMETDGLTITFANGQLVATNGNDSQTISLAQLSKMYFSGDNTTNIQTVEQATASEPDEATEIYDLQGRKVEGQRQAGIYILKSKKGIRKVYIK